MEANAGPPGLPRCRRVMHAMVSDPGEAGAVRPLSTSPTSTSAALKASSFPTGFSRLNPFNRARHSSPFTAYGLHACGPTLKDQDCSLTSKDSLPGGWPTLPGRDSHPLDNATLPGRTSVFPLWDLLHKLGFRQKVPRQVHAKADPKAQETFKKNGCGS